MEDTITGWEILQWNREARAKRVGDMLALRARIRAMDVAGDAQRTILRVTRIHKWPKLENYSRIDPNVLIKRGLDMIIGSAGPCPSLPCGSDDAWMDAAEWSTKEGHAYIDAAAILFNRESHRNAPNLHAFDEEYYSS